LIPIPFTILQNHHVALFALRIFLDAFTFFLPPYVNITPLINNIHLGYICQERVKQHEWRISHHYTRLILMFNVGRLPSKLNVLGHDGNTLGMNGAQVCILKHTNKVSL
jgi:hypothetical protein